MNLHHSGVPTQTPAYRKDLCMANITQDLRYAFIPHLLTALKNMAFPMRPSGWKYPKDTLLDFLHYSATHV